MTAATVSLLRRFESITADAFVDELLVLFIVVTGDNEKILLLGIEPV